MSAIGVLVLGLLGDPLFDPEERRAGPPVQQFLKRGTFGDAIDYEDFREVYQRSPELARRRHPFYGADYAVRSYRESIMQGRSVFRHRRRSQWLVHDFFCWQMAGTAEMPWSCDATAFVFSGERPVTERRREEWPRTHVEEGFVLADPEQVAEVQGDFDHVLPHPEQPVFAAIRLGCCGGESRVSVHDPEGRTLCPPADLLIGWDEATGPAGSPNVGVWDKIKVEQGHVACPGGGSASFAPW